MICRYVLLRKNNSRLKVRSDFNSPGVPSRP